MTDRRAPPDWDDIVAHGRQLGLAAVGLCRARPWTANRARLEHHRESGRGADMAFTLRRPARSADPTRTMRNASTLLVGALAYDDGAGAGCDSGELGATGHVAAYARSDHYGRLRALLSVLADRLRSEGHRALVLADDNAVLDKEAAWRAGVGWYGKNSLLLVPGLGSNVVLGSVVTDAPFDRTSAPVSDRCGPCRRCVAACPTDAIDDHGTVDSRRCLSWLLQAPGSFPVEHRVALGRRIYGCDDCQDVCPPNRRTALVRRQVAADRLEPDGAEPDRSRVDGGATGGRIEWIDLLALLELDDPALLEVVGRWYIAGRDPDVVRRNALVVLGNIAPDDPSITEAVQQGIDRTLRRYSAAGPLLAEHAHWALNRRRRR
ncbi:MAG: 4Fe-4S double cluster binding domain-containing protein [Microthrixaceae bacterium]